MSDAADLLTTAQVADLLGVTVATVNRWALLGKATPVRKLPGPTGAYLYERAEVDALVAARAA